MVFRNFLEHLKFSVHGEADRNDCGKLLPSIKGCSVANAQWSATVNAPDLDTAVHHGVAEALCKVSTW